MDVPVEAMNEPGEEDEESLRVNDSVFSHHQALNNEGLQSFTEGSTEDSTYFSSRQLIDDSIAENNNQNWETTTNTTSNNGDLHFRMLLDNFSEADDANNGSILNLERIAREIEVSIPVREHRWRLKIYKDTFVGSELVDFLVRSRHATSRAQAVALGRKIARQFNLFEHVHRDHELKDAYLFYRFVENGRRTRPQATIYQEDLESEKTVYDAHLQEIAEVLQRELDVRDRFYRLKRYRNCFVASDAVAFVVQKKIANTREEAVDIGRRLETELGLWRHVVTEHSFSDDFLFFRFVNRRHDVVSSTINESHHNVSTRQNSIKTTVTQLSKHRLLDIADEMRKGLDVRDRRFRLKLYRSCFVAEDALNFLVEKQFAMSRSEAVELGRRIESELSAFYHVTNDHDFKDGYFFFRFDSTHSDGSSSETKLFTQDNSSMSASDIDEKGLKTIARKLRLGVKIKDRMYRLKTYRRCFVGCEAVDFLVQARFAVSREDAVELGRRLVTETQLFEHVTQGHEFEDGYLFYHFIDDKEKEDDVSEHGTLNPSVSTAFGESAGVSITTIDLGKVGELTHDSLKEVSRNLKTAVRSKDRMYRLKIYRNCFVGSEAVDFLVQSGIASSRSAAVAIGRRVQIECKSFQHVEDDHMFDDAYLFFRFNTAETTISNHDSVTASLMRSISVQQPSMTSKRLLLNNLDLLRKAERDTLRKLLNESKKSVQFVEVVGNGGNGKSALIMSTFSLFDGILFAAVKFDEGGIVETLEFVKRLFVELCKQVSASMSLKHYLRELGEENSMTDSEFAALLEWEPQCSTLFSKVRRSDETKSGKRISDFHAEIKRGLRSFLSALARVAPVVLFLDDAESADVESLETLNFVVCGSDFNILACVAYREDRLTKNHPLVGWRNDALKHFNLETVLLNDLSEPDLSALLAHLLKSDNDDVKSLAKLISNRTNGNLFFVLQLLEELQDSGLLQFCFLTMQWKFSIEECRSKTQVTNNVAKLLSSRIGQLSRNTEQLLKLVSCFDGPVCPTTLEATKEVLFIFEDLETSLGEACDDQLLIFNASEATYKFAHDEVHDAAYDLLPAGKERQMIHFDIGTALSKEHRKQPDNRALLFKCADQFAKAGVSLARRLLRDNDVLKVVNVFISAGKQAASLFAYQPAAYYIKMGAELLGSEKDEVFRRHEDLATKLFLLRAKTELCAGRIVESRKCAEAILSYARSADQKRAAQLILIKSYASENMLEKQFEFALEVLEKLDQEIPNCKIRYERTMKQIASFADEDLLSLPPMTDKEIEFSIEVIIELIHSALQLQRRDFLCMGLSRIVSLTMEHGKCRMTPLIFVLLGLEFISVSNNLTLGQRFIDLGLRPECDLDLEVKSRVLLHTCIGLGCIQPISKCMYLGLDGFETGMSAGDVATAFYSAAWYLVSFFNSGMPIPSLIEDAEKFILQMQEYNQYCSLSITTPLHQMLLCLCGKSDGADRMEDVFSHIQELPVSDDMKKNGLGACFTYCMQLNLFLGKLDKAIECFLKLKDESLGKTEASAVSQNNLFYCALISMANQRRGRRVSFQMPIKSEVKRYVDAIKHLIEGGAINLGHKYLLVEAEFDALTSKEPEQTLRKYEQAVAAAAKAGFLQDGALASLLCGQFCMETDEIKERASTQILRAHELFVSWGATAVAESLLKRFPESFPDGFDHHRRISSSLRSRPHFREAVILKHKSLHAQRSARR